MLYVNPFTPRQSDEGNEGEGPERHRQCYEKHRVSAKSDWSLICDYSAFSALLLVLLAAMVMHGTEAPVNDLMFVKQLDSGPLSKATFFRSFHTKIATALSQRSLG